MSPTCKGSAETIDTKSRTVGIVAAKGAKKSLSYDRLVVATGSRLFRPNIPGLAEHGIQRRLDSMTRSPSTSICIAWRTGRRRTGATRSSWPAAVSPASRRRPRCPRGCATILGKDAKTRVIIVDRNKRDRTRHGRRPPPCHRGGPAQARRGNPARRRRRVARRIRRHAFRRRTHRNRDRDLGGGHSRRAVDRSRSPPSATISAGCWSTAICACRRCPASSPPAMPPEPHATMSATTR